MIAMALSCNPSLLIADEPTTALDVTIQAQILELMKRLQRDYGSSILLITHDMGVVSELAERIVVMYAGGVVEEGPKSAVFRDPQHPYTWGLLGSIPRVGRPRVQRLTGDPGRAAVAARAAARAAASRPAAPTASISARPGRSSPSGSRRAAATRAISTRRRGVRSRSGRRREHERLEPGPARGGRPRQALPRADERREARRRRCVHAVDGVSLEVRRGETLGIVGESGCGKSTLGRLLVRLHEPTSGTVRFGGDDITTLSRRELRPFRREMQMIFQDPYASLNPRKRVGQIVADPFEIHGVGSTRGDPRAACGSCSRSSASRRTTSTAIPHEFSGGQRQRIGVARALALSPQLIVADEPVSALDVSIQAQVDQPARRPAGRVRPHVRLHRARPRRRPPRLRPDRGDVPRRDRRDRRPPTSSSRTRSTRTPRRSSRRSRRSTRARTTTPRERIVLEGEVPSPIAPPSGCRFHPRCPYATEICRVEQPAARRLRRRPLRRLPPPARRSGPVASEGAEMSDDEATLQLGRARDLVPRRRRARRDSARRRS